MKLAISNIAWAPQDARSVYAMMQARGFNGLEIAPGLAFAGQEDAFVPSPEAEAAFRADLAEFGLSAVSMQSLLFGVVGAKLFGSADELAALERGLERAIALAGRLGIGNLVFGSPGNRVIPEGMPMADARAHAADLFRRLGDKAQAAGTVLALEPNPAAYGTNFMTHVASAADFTLMVDHPAITLNYDMGALYMNDEQDQAGALYRRAAGKVSHVHISEPQLAPAPADAASLQTIAADLIGQGYDKWFSIEMRAPAADGLAIIDQCLAATADALFSAGSAAHAQ
ncbi:sugar phosphate isomerase/epimerase family protein [Novosphingobium sp. KACC 22771]|uniref:sugar phosphate isomerase/epimerase family protein n=1 Tax=Novosphingobium sp. KACC 22771 TaxID=3025670 RepID=UPI002366302D|nr:TIM barrel protein [Novosphingobium sp. KACC 22771]WDF72868.1 TIM barrel protein [Novosphingobium sp. KACC 22771]